MDHTSHSIVVLQDQTAGKSQWLCFRNPVTVIQTNKIEQVEDCLKEVEKHVNSGLYAAGFITYEAASGLDPALITHQSSELPLLWFSIHANSEVFEFPKHYQENFHLNEWKPSVTEEEYCNAIEKIKKHIRDGDTYQVNYTMRLRNEFEGNPWDLFLRLHKIQNSKYSAYIKFDQFSICSVSPELFVSLDAGKLTCKPMKGTIKRGLNNRQDAEREQWLHTSEKNRAENVMIVDMIRNDLGTVARTGSVQVDKLFAIEKYPTVLQMTSTVTAQTDAPVSEVISKMFPCASITGAPKVKTMEIIKALEPDPRGIYTGSIGYIAPDGRAQFNVAIRSVVINNLKGTAEYGVGGGIVWDSNAKEEFEECKTKAGVLMQDFADFELFETVLWDPQHGLYLIDEHIERLWESAKYFQFSLSLDTLYGKIFEFRNQRRPEKTRVRIRLQRHGKLRLEESTFATFMNHRVCLATKPLPPASKFVCHKTTQRSVYDKALVHEQTQANDPTYHDVILWDADGFITESCISNVVIHLDGKWLTPSTEQGLLPGVFRRRLLESGAVLEAPISKADLLRAQDVYLVNSVRGWMHLEKERDGKTWLVNSEFVYERPGT